MKRKIVNIIEVDLFQIIWINAVLYVSCVLIINCCRCLRCSSKLHNNSCHPIYRLSQQLLRLPSQLSIRDAVDRKCDDFDGVDEYVDGIKTRTPFSRD